MKALLRILALGVALAFAAFAGIQTIAVTGPLDAHPGVNYDGGPPPFTVNVDSPQWYPKASIGLAPRVAESALSRRFEELDQESPHAQTAENRR